jgi:hypothetical protein
MRGALMAASDVIVIGGAPFAWKTTLAKQLAAQPGYALVAIDDLSTAVCAVTIPTVAFGPASHGRLGLSRLLCGPSTGYGDRPQ